jgi:DNA polymerase elongation subunit (family B)
MLQYEYVFEVNHDIVARIYDSEADESRYRRYSKDLYSPPLYLPSTNGDYYSFTDNKPLKKLTFNKASDFRECLKNYKDYDNCPVYGNTSFVQNFIREEFKNSIDSDHKFHTWYLDIEVRSINGFPQPEVAQEEITLIQIYDTKIKNFIILGIKDLNIEITSTFGEVKYIKCSNEKEMMHKFISILDKLNPTAIVGFNSYGFDFPYITNRLTNLHINNNQLSPVRQIIWTDAKTKEGIEYKKVSWEGRYLLDIQDLYVKYKGSNLPRLSLEAISQHELGDGKINHDEYFSFEEFYNNDFDRFVEYGLKDVELLIQLENKLKFIDTAKYVAYSCGVNVYDVFGTYRQWMSIIYNTALAENKILPTKAQYTNSDDLYLGGWVFSKPGKYDWVFSFDFASLYPSVIRFLNLGVDTLVKDYEMNDELKYIKEKYLTYYNKEFEEKIKEHNHNMDEFYFLKNLVQNKEEIHKILTKNNVCMTPNGYFYKKEKQSFSSMMMEKFFNQRKVHKKDLKKYGDIVEMIDLEIKSRK